MLLPTYVTGIGISTHVIRLYVFLTVEQKLNYLLERIVLSCGFQSQAILKVIKNNHKPGIAFPEFLEEITNTFEFLKLEMSLTCEMILDLLDEIVMGVLKKGYLTKRGGNRKNWKKRWFILKENTLFYYESRENLTQKVCISVVELHRV